MSNSEKDTGIAAVAHIAALFTSILGPLIVYMMAEDGFVEENAAAALNWQIMFLIYSMIAFVLSFVVIGLLLIPIIILLDFVFCIIAAVKAADGDVWEYPITVEFV